MPRPKGAAAAPVNVKALVQGLLPFFILLALLTALVSRHMDWLWGSLAAMGVLTVASTIGKWLPDGFAKHVSDLFHEFLTNGSVARALWVGCVVFGTGSFFVASAHVSAEKPAPVWVYLMAEAAGEASQPLKIDSASLDRVNPREGFVMRASMGRRVWLLSSTYLRTPPLDVGPWAAPVIAYPERFDTVSTVALLPVPRLLRYVGEGRALRVAVRNDSGTLVAEDSLVDRQRVPSLLLSVVEPPPPSDALGQRWRAALAALAKTSADSQKALAFTEWSSSHKWLRARRAIMEGDNLVIQFISADGDTVARQTVPVRRAYTDAIITERTR